MSTETRNGDWITKRTVTLKAVRLDIPRRGFPLAVYLPLEEGEILNPNVTLKCPPGVAILDEHLDPFGVMAEFVPLYLEWLYFKSGK